MKKPYRFIGHMHPFDFGGRERYETGRVYELLVVKDPYEVKGYPNTRVIIEQPIRCPYDSIELFYKNWIKVDESEIV